MAVALLCLAGAYFSAKWSFANTASTHAEFKEVADLMTELAPGDPQTHFAAAVLYEKAFLLEELPKSLAEYEKAVALSPNNYLLWLEFGNALGRNGDAAKAESALRKAMELAPNYAQVKWALGNALVRQGKTDEGFAEIRRAVAGDSTYINSSTTIAWQIFEGDIDQVRKAIGDSSRASAALASLVAGQKRFEEAFEIWNTIAPDEKKGALLENSKALYAQFIEGKKHRLALHVYSQVISDKPDAFGVGKIHNGGFEADINPEASDIFEWKIGSGSHPQFGFDNMQVRSGSRSLLMVSYSDDGRGFRQLEQTIAVEPSRTYSFHAFTRADLKTSVTLKWEVADPSDGKVLGSTNAVVNSADWTNMKAAFTVPKNTEAVIIRLVREKCSSLICPISGRLWIDDLSLEGQ